MKDGKIKVLALIWSMEAGGAQQIVINNLRDLVEDSEIEFKVCVFCSISESKYDREIVERSYPVRYMNYPSSRIRIRYIRGVFNLMVARRAFADVIRQEQPDIVHVHIDELLDKCLYGIRVNNVPVRFDTLHSNPLRYRGRVLRTIRRAFQQDNFIALCLNEAQYKVAQGYYGIKRHEILHNGIDLTSIRERVISREAAREELHLPQDAFVVAAVGRLDPVKNLALLIDAFRIVLDKNHSAVLLIAGDGMLRSRLEQRCVEHGIRDHVIFTGNLSNVVPVYCATDVLSLSSFSEASPLVLVEAQCCGTRCVISHGCPEESIITDRVRRLEDSAGAEEWADALLETDYHGVAVCTEDEYEVHQASATLKRYYLQYYQEFSAALHR